MFRFAPLALCCVACSPYSGLRAFETGATPGGTAEVEEITYRLVTLSVDGDPSENHLPDALGALDVLMPGQGWSVEAFNATLADNVLNWSAIYLEVHPGVPLHLHVSGGEVLSDGSVWLDESLASPLEGDLVGDDGFAAGPGDIALNFVVGEGVAPVPLDLLETEAEGVFAETLSGTFHALISLDNVIAEIVAPAIPSEGYDLGGDGVPESPDAVLDFVWSLAPTIGDVTLADGTPAISARLNFTGELAVVE